MKVTRFIFIGLPVWLMLTGCCGDHSPTIDILGSYFPAWIVCIVLGLALTLIARQILIGLKINTHLHPAPVVYICMLLIFTFTLWLAFFLN